MKVTVNRAIVHGAKKWMVRWHEAGKLRRKFFTGREAAEAHAISQRGSTLGADQQFLVLPQVDKEKLMLLYKHSQEHNIDLLELLSSAKPGAAGSPALEDALKEMLSTKQKSGRAEDYLVNLRVIISQFTRGRERLPVNQVSLHDIESFLSTHSIQYRSTLRARLSTLFNFCVRRGYLVANPCSRLEAITLTHKPPAVLTAVEAKNSLEWLQTNPSMLAWFVLSTFAGLRPEEAEQTTWQDINFSEKWIKVEAQTTKVRQRRVVYPMRMAMEWLRRAKKLKSELPLDPHCRKRQLKQLREVLGWKVWKKDVTRHTAASMWLASCGSAATVATALGHSESILRKNYMALVTKAEAQKFWELKPKPIKRTDKNPPESQEDS